MSMSSNHIALALVMLSAGLVDAATPSESVTKRVGDPELAAKYRAERLARKAENFAKRQPKGKS